MSLARIKLTDFDRNKAQLAKRTSRLLDFVAYPVAGERGMNADEHPLYNFFKENFSCDKYNYQTGSWAQNYPKNLVSINRLHLKLEFLEALKNGVSVDEWVNLSRHMKEDLANCYLTYLCSYNKERYTAQDNGLNISRGSLGLFLKNTYWKMLVEEEKMTEADLGFVKKYFMVITSDQLALPQRAA